MNIPQLDTSDYNRTLASIGVALIAISIAIPWLVLHDASALEISSARLARLTPTAHDTLLARQHQIAFAQSAWPLISVPVALIGASILGWSVVRIRALQPHRDKLVVATGAKAEAELTQQTAGDVFRNAELDQAREAAWMPSWLSASELASDSFHESRNESGEAAVADRPTKREEPIATDARDSIEAQIHLEESALSQIEKHLGDQFELWRRPKLVYGERELYVDALISKSVSTEIFAMVEVKSVSRSSSVSVIVDSVLAQFLRFSAAMGEDAEFAPIANSWAVLVYPDVSRSNSNELDSFNEIAEQVEKIDAGPASISLVKESEIKDIEIPADVVRPNGPIYELRKSEGPITSPA